MGPQFSVCLTSLHSTHSNHRLAALLQGPGIVQNAKGDLVNCLGQHPPLSGSPSFPPSHTLSLFISHNLNFIYAIDIHGRTQQTDAQSSR